MLDNGICGAALCAHKRICASSIKSYFKRATVPQKSPAASVSTVVASQQLVPYVLAFVGPIATRLNALQVCTLWKRILPLAREVWTDLDLSYKACGRQLSAKEVQALLRCVPVHCGVMKNPIQYFNLTDQMLLTVAELKQTLIGLQTRQLAALTLTGTQLVLTDDIQELLISLNIPKLVVSHKELLG
jgi:hypothetical protein